METMRECAIGSKYLDERLNAVQTIYMAKTSVRRAQLRDKLIELGTEHVAKNRLEDLKARTLAKEAGCAVGAIYNVFEDLNELILAINVRTFRDLAKYVTERQEKVSNQPPLERLREMGSSYLDYAEANYNVWITLFEHKITDTTSVPDWYLQELRGLFEIINRPLAELNPGLDASDLDLATRALFSSVHGIVSFGLEGRLSAVPKERLETMLDRTIVRIVT